MLQQDDAAKMGALTRALEGTPTALAELETAFSIDASEARHRGFSPYLALCMFTTPALIGD